MEPQPIAPLPVTPALGRVPGRQRDRSGGGFEQAFREQREAAGDRGEFDADHAEPQNAAPSRLQPTDARIRKDQDRDDRRIDVVV